MALSYDSLLDRKEALHQGERRLAAVMFTDMVGYTALGQRNESLSLALVEEQRKLIRPILARHNGREVKTIGDAFLVEFPNALDAVRCAYDIQRATKEFNISMPPEKRIHLRVGLHLGDVVESQGDISGDAVNVASRIEPLAEDGGVCLTRQVFESTHSKFDVPLVSIGVKTMKNVSEPMEVYKLVMPWEQHGSPIATTSYPTNRVAILPFRSMSPDPNDEYFADGLTEELIDRLCQIGELKVIARTSVMNYKKKEKNAAQIGRELRAGALVEGSVRKADSRIRVTAQLINANTEEHLWSSRYDRNLEDIFEVQSDVAERVAEALRVKILSPEKERIERKPTVSTAAYTLYRKGRYLWNKRMPDDLKRAAEYFELAVHEDPGFALGYAGQADCCTMLRTDWGIDREANFEKAKAAVTKALDLDPGLAEAHATRGMILFDECNLRLAEEEYRKAIELKPSYATVHQWYMWVLAPQMRWDEALEQIEKAVELDPLSPIITDNLGHYYLWRRDYSKAAEIYKKALELGFEGAHGDLATTYGRMKMFDEMRREAAVWAERVQGTVPLAGKFASAYAACLEGDRRTLRELLPELEARSQEAGMSAYYAALFRFSLGDNDKGFEWLERSCSRKEGAMVLILEPELDGVRKDPRYFDLLKRLGLG